MNRRGSILMISLWILTILVIFAIGLGYRSSLNLRLAYYQKDRLRAAYLAGAGIMKAVNILEQDALEAQTRDYDTIEACGVNLNGRPPQELFSMDSDNSLEGFRIGYYDAAGDFIYGMQDEEGKININGAAEPYRKRMSALLSARQIVDAQGLSSALADWLKPDSTIELAKKEKLMVPEELLLVFEYYYSQLGYPQADARPKAQETFLKIKDTVTIYGDGRLDINTAGLSALTIFAASLSATAEEEGCAAKLAESIIDLRASLKQGYFSKIEDINLDVAAGSADENLLSKLKSNIVLKSEYFRIEVIAKVNKVSQKVAAIYDRQAKRLVYWRQD